MEYGVGYRNGFELFILTLTNLRSTNWPCDFGKEWYYYVFVVPNADEQHLSEKASVICQVEKPSSSEKRLHKGILES